ncbi:60S ribosomal protein L24 [Datura stramonium]|uniref:60S ribosomal protein L24 n=1 Tax=Datura stramonium TaxID=4076 RepID=A0ABS8RR75_DATST|nr:60S ribosomal protein L24 [Datura stramonium]
MNHCSLLHQISGQNFVASVVPRFTLGEASDLFASDSQDIAQEAAKKRRRTHQVSLTLGQLWVLPWSEIKERIKKTKDEKKAKKAEVQAKSQKAGGKGSVSRGGASKGPKLGGGGGKR